MTHDLGRRAIPAPYALPVGFAMFLAVGTAAAGLHGRLPATGVLIACAAVAGAVSFAAEPVAAVLLNPERDTVIQTGSPRTRLSSSAKAPAFPSRPDTASAVARNALSAHRNGPTSAHGK